MRSEEEILDDWFSLNLRFCGLPLDGQIRAFERVDRDFGTRPLRFPSRHSHFANNLNSFISARASVGGFRLNQSQAEDGGACLEIEVRNQINEIGFRRPGRPGPPIRQECEKPQPAARLIEDGFGRPMTPSHTSKLGQRLSLLCQCEPIPVVKRTDHGPACSSRQGHKPRNIRCQRAFDQGHCAGLCVARRNGNRGI